MTDLEIAQGATMRPISDIARAAGIQEETLSPYGRYIAKVDPAPYAAQPDRARLVLVTAINPTPAGEGKTTVSVGLADGLHRLGKKSMLALREPSLGPVFGMKGGAAGGGYAQVVPMEDINLHFTGDLHAITSGQQPAGGHGGQPHPAGQRPGHRPPPGHLAAVHGHERPPAAADRVRPGRQGQRHAPGGRL